MQTGRLARAATFALCVVSIPVASQAQGPGAPPVPPRQHGGLPELAGQIQTLDAAVKQLEEDLAEEVLTRMAADAAESAARVAADITLEGSISAEATTRNAADTSLQNNIANESTERAAADTSLQEDINLLQARIAALDDHVSALERVSDPLTITCLLEDKLRRLLPGFEPSAACGLPPVPSDPAGTVCDPARGICLITNAQDPARPGYGVSSQWMYGGHIGAAAGDLMCQAAGASRLATYTDLLHWDAAGAFAGLGLSEETRTMLGERTYKAQGPATLWLHRVTETVRFENPISPGTFYDSPPGAGGRCNEWTAPSNHIMDGEFAVIVDGRLVYYFDNDTRYDGLTPYTNKSWGTTCASASRAIACVF